MFRVTSAFVFTVALACAAGPTMAQTEAIAMAKHDLKVGFPVGGRIAEIQVEAGDQVKEGDVLATLEDKQGESLIELWQLRANSDVQVRLQKKRLELAQLEADRLKQLQEKDAAAPFEVQRAAIQAALQQIALEQADQEYQEARMQLKQAQARHEQYVLRAPRDGAIERIALEAGETVEQLQPVMRLVHTEELRDGCFGAAR